MAAIEADRGVERSSGSTLEVWAHEGPRAGAVARCESLRAEQVEVSLTGRLTGGRQTEPSQLFLEGRAAEWFVADPPYPFTLEECPTSQVRIRLGIDDSLHEVECLAPLAD